jgi:hypothetical protein
MKCRIIFFIFAISSMVSLSQSQPLTYREFYEQLFEEYEHSFYKQDNSDSIIFDDEIYFGKRDGWSAGFYHITLKKIEDNKLKIKYRFVGAPQKGLLPGTATSVGDPVESFINTLIHTPYLPGEESKTTSVENKEDKSNNSVKNKSKDASNVVTTETVAPAKETSTNTTQVVSADTTKKAGNTSPATSSVTSMKTVSLQVEEVFAQLPENYLDRKKYNDALRWAQLPARFVIGVTSAFAFNHRTVYLNSYNYENLGILKQRNENETFQASVPVGIHIGGAYYGNHLTLGVMAQHFGYNYSNPNKAVNWTTGLNDTSSVDKTEKRSVVTVGLDYCYTTYQRGASLLLLAGSSLSFTNGKGTINTPDLPYGIFSSNLKLGAGLSYKFCYSVDFRVYPVLYYNLNLTTGSKLSTRFYTTGLEFGLFFNLWCLEKYKAK